jgi:flagellar basal-body rod modification protein FlgD
MSIASVASQQNGTTAATSTGTTSTNTASTGSSDPLASLSSNFGSFLSLLMTQLKNQDPTSPLDTNQFTSELVQFSGLEQQINTNSSLSQLIQLTQAGDVVQSSSMVGKSVTVNSDHVPLQNGTGKISFTAPSAEPVTISIADASGNDLRDVTLNAAQGVNSWTWDGTDNFGSTVADGSYKVAITSAANRHRIERGDSGAVHRDRHGDRRAEIRHHARPAARRALDRLRERAVGRQLAPSGERPPV